MDAWPLVTPGVVELPSGRRVRGRSLRAGTSTGHLAPEVAVHCVWHRPEPQPWPVRWVRWPDFGLPLAPPDARAALAEALELAATLRVEVCCGGGRGRTGTALAVMAALDGVPPSQAVAWVRSRYAAGAVETPWQRRWVASNAHQQAPVGDGTAGLP